MYIKLLVLSIIITSLLFAFFNNIYLTIKSIHLDEKPSFIKSMTYQFLNVIIIFTFLLMLVIFSQYGDEIMNTLLYFINPCRGLFPPEALTYLIKN